MLPPSKSPLKNAEIAGNGKRERCNTGGSSKSDTGSVSMDLFEFLQRTEDFQMDGGLSALSSDDTITPLRSADFVENVILSENTESPSTPSNGKVGKFTTKLERNITGDDIAPLNMEFRISSRNWVKDYEAEESVNLLAMTMHPSLFTEKARNIVELEDISTSPPPVSLIDSHEEYQIPLQSSGNQVAPMPTFNHLRIYSQDWVTDFQDESASFDPMHPEVFTELMDDAITDATAAQPNVSHPQLKSPTYCDEDHHISLTPSSRQSESMPPLPHTVDSLRAVSPAATQASITQSSTTTPGKKRKKKHRTQELNESVVVEPTGNDVLSGRGGFANNHPGNVRFREKALEFRPWYEQSSKEEKQRIADLLVESVTSEGHRFLGQGKDGLWHEVVHGAHRKASQALRERIKRGSPGHA